jgi:hypothetical protein
VAISVAIWAPRGLWGLFSERFNIRLFPVGYWLWPAEPAAGSGPAGLSFLRRRRAGPPG